ncbi:hypothetical protein E4U51_006291 [Claviceps purpurea]|nr:hypothetical protein E4U51_006291 [Claviceps purpurea]
MNYIPSSKLEFLVITTRRPWYQQGALNEAFYNAKGFKHAAMKLESFHREYPYAARPVPPQKHVNRHIGPRRSH